MRPVNLIFIGLALAISFLAVHARAVTITNLTTNTVVFLDDFESGGFSPSVGTWSVLGGADPSSVTVTSSTTPPNPGPAEGSFYARSHRETPFTNSEGGMVASLSAPQVTAGDRIHMSAMLYIPDDGVAISRAFFGLGDGNLATNGRAIVRSDGAGNVIALVGGLASQDTGLDYIPDTWQHWELEYAVGGDTFSVRVNGVSAGPFASFTTGQVNTGEIFNGAHDPAGAFFVDAGDSVNIIGNTTATSIDVGSLTSVGGSVNINGNTAATSIDMGALTTVGGELTITDNTSATVISMDSLNTVGGELNISGNIVAGELDLSSVVSAGELTVSGNTSAEVINMDSLVTVSGELTITDNTSATTVRISSLTSAGGSVRVGGNTSATVVDISGLVSSGGAVSANGNTSAAIVDFGSLVSANGDVTVEDNTSATAVHISSLSSAGGNVAINGNSAATTIDLGSLGSVGGDISITENMSATAIDLSSLVSMSGNIDISANSSAGLIDLSILASVGLISITENTSATTIDLSSLGSVGGDIEISGNASATAIDLSSLVSTSGAIEISGNTAAGVIDLPGLVTAGGDVAITDNTSATIIDLSSLVSTNGDIEITDNASATSVHISSLTSAGGSVHVDGNTSAMVVDVGGLVSSGGAVSANGNTSATIVDFSSLVSANGDVTVEDNTSATSFHISSLTSAGGAVSLNDNTSATSIDLGGLTSAGGAVSLNDNTSATSIDLGSLQSATEVTITGNGNAAVSLGSLESVTGSVTLESTGTGTFALGDADVAGETNLSLDGYTTVGASTAGGATAVTMLNSAATMEVTLPDGAFSSANPVTFSIERLPGGVETVGGDVITHLETYSFDFAIPTLDSAAELNFEIDLSALAEPNRLSLLGLLRDGALLTLGVRGDAPGAELQLFDVCAGGGPVVDACVVVEWLDENRLLLDPLGGIDPSILRLEGLVGHFSTYSFVAVVQAVPEPTSALLLMLGAGVTLGGRRVAVRVPATRQRETSQLTTE